MINPKTFRKVQIMGVIVHTFIAFGLLFDSKNNLLKQ